MLETLSERYPLLHTEYAYLAQRELSKVQLDGT